MEHPAKICFTAKFGIRRVPFEEFKVSRKLPTSQIRSMKTSSRFRAPREYFLVLAGIRVVRVEKLKPCLDYVLHIPQDERRTLLAVLLDVYSKVSTPRIHRPFHVYDRDLACDFIAADIGKADGFENPYAFDDPPNFGFPVDRFEHATGGGRSDYIVRPRSTFSSGREKQA